MDKSFSLTDLKPAETALPTQELLHKRFLSIARLHALFHTAFLSFLFLQLLSLLVFLSHWSRSTISGMAIAFFFLSLFSYVVLTFFLKTQKEEQLLSLQKEFAKHYLPAHYAEASLSTAAFLAEQEAISYTCSFLGKTFKHIGEKAKNWLFWKTFFRMKELLLQSGVENLVTLIKQSPTESSLHRALADAYTQLSFLYLPEFSPLLWTPSFYRSEEIIKRFSYASKRAIEELHIVQSQVGSSPELLAKIAELYRLQGKNKEEITQYEALLELAPEHAPAQLRLGILYFLQGEQAKGLALYAHLHVNYPKEAEALIEHYDSLIF
ncbi:MAG: hypothetical protein FJZ58_02110 [Chlamydiae bacterium]|nr:hypothetical protein [Chlamydiota bacterium]